jgi:ribonuclease-3
MHDFSEFESAIEIEFNNKQLLKQAFTHRSYLNENRDIDWSHNERLEYLGDAVLELAVTKYLFNTYPKKQEGELTTIRAAMVNTNTISDAADQLNMDRYVLLSRGQQLDRGRAHTFILANTFEAVIGAIYTDHDFETACDFIADTIFPRSDDIIENELHRDAKSKFQERAQDNADITPTYEIIDESGPDHETVYTAGVYLDDTQVAQGRGKSKQDAERTAAKRAIKKKGWR